MAQINARYVFQRCCDNREPAITQFQLQFDNVQFGVRVCVCVCSVDAGAGRICDRQFKSNE